MITFLWAFSLSPVEAGEARKENYLTNDKLTNLIFLQYNQNICMADNIVLPLKYLYQHMGHDL